MVNVLGGESHDGVNGPYPLGARVAIPPEEWLRGMNIHCPSKNILTNK